MRDSNADISKARELLGYDPEYDFEKGIALAIDWYKETPDRKNEYPDHSYTGPRKNISLHAQKGHVLSACS